MSFKPCPCCNATAHSVHTEDFFPQYYFNHDYIAYKVYCEDCGLKLEIITGFDYEYPCSCCFDILTELENRWNKRASRGVFSKFLEKVFSL